MICCSCSGLSESTVHSGIPPAHFTEKQWGVGEGAVAEEKLASDGYLGPSLP